MKRFLVAAGLICLTIFPSGCAKSCQDKAQDEWMDQQEQAIDNGQTNSIKGYFSSLEDYQIQKCGSS